MSLLSDQTTLDMGPIFSAPFEISVDRTFLTIFKLLFRSKFSEYFHKNIVSVIYPLNMGIIF